MKHTAYPFRVGGWGQPGGRPPEHDVRRPHHRRWQALRCPGEVVKDAERVITNAAYARW